MKVSVILVNYNGRPYNEACIRSVLESSFDGQLHICVVDNGSTDGSMEELEKKWVQDAGFSFLYMGENRGFSAANNAGIRQAMRENADYLLLLNNDTCIERTMIQELVNAEQRHRNCILVPKIYYYDKKDTIWSAGGGFSRIVKKPFGYGENRKDAPEFDVEKRCENGNGCCIFMRCEVLNKVGFLDEDFFLYYEDTEFFMRAKEKGVETCYVPAARMYHKVNGSTGGNDNPACVYYITRNWLMCHRRHLKGSAFFAFLLYFFLNRAAWMCIWAVRGKHEQVKAVGEGIGDFLKGKSGKYRSRI